jgi:hypothetical protein
LTPVTPITKKKKDKKEKPPSKMEMFRTLADYINGGFTNLFTGECPKFPNKYHIQETIDGERKLLIEKKNQVVQYVQKKKFKSDVLRFIGNHLYHNDVLANMTERGSEEFYNAWELCTDTFKDIPDFRFKSDPGLCFSRMPFDPISNDGSMCHKFKEICSRVISNEQAFRAFIGSVFVPESDRQQYLWIKGEGQDGKGATIRFLHKCLKAAAFNSEVPEQNDMFWNASLPGKRLIIFADCRAPKFPASPKFKMISGGDAIPIREMHKTLYLSEINCKFMFASNIFPEITGQKSDQRRAIICEIADTDAPMSSTYENEMWAEEAPYIVGWCLDEYKRLCPNNEHIPVDKEPGEAIASAESSDVCALFYEHFRIEKGGFVSSEEMIRVFEHRYKNQAEAKIRKFRQWLYSYHKIKTGEKLGGRRGYLGVQFKDGNAIFTDKL